MKAVIAIPAISALAYRAYSRKSLTPIGILTAFVTAIVHAIHPWSVCFALLAVFFIAGTSVTKVKHNAKAKLTQSATGSTGGEGARNHVQVIANSGVASTLVLLHLWQLRKEGRYGDEHLCWKSHSDPLVIGIVANYAAVAADTFSSELGILSKAEPRLITAPWRVVPPGTNGGVTTAGLASGLLGACILSVTSTLLLPFCGEWSLVEKVQYTVALTAAGFSGTLIDSLLGALLQASVVDIQSGKVVEGDWGRKVLVQNVLLASKSNKPRDCSSRSTNMGNTSSADIPVQMGSPEKLDSSKANSASSVGQQFVSRKIEVGADVLDNNAVNIITAALASGFAMICACMIWKLPLRSILGL